MTLIQWIVWRIILMRQEIEYRKDMERAMRKPVKNSYDKLQ